MLNYLKISVLLLCAMFPKKELLANDHLNRGNQLKAVYLIHFAELTQWPESLKESDTFKLCLYVPPTLYPYLEELSQDPIQGKQVEIEIIDTYNQQHQCKIIYFSENESIKNIQMLSELYPKTLLVGNYPEFIEAGGSISFTQVNNKIKLIINLNQIRHSGLDISSKLLRIATVLE